MAFCLSLPAFFSWKLGRYWLEPRRGPSYDEDAVLQHPPLLKTTRFHPAAQVFDWLARREERI